MANEWIYTSGAACYDSATAGYALSQVGILTAGNIVVVEFTISGMTQGKLVLDSLVGKPEYTEDGTYQAIGIAASPDLTFIGDEYIGLVFDGCIDTVSARNIPFIVIKDNDDNVVFTQTDETGVTAEGSFIRYLIDWSDIADGCYRITMTELGVDYESDCIVLKDSHPCTILLSWTNNENAYGFNYSDLSFVQYMRVEAKLWKAKHTDEKKEVFTDSAGNRTILYVRTSKEELLTVAEMPDYMHDALSVGRNHDTFTINGTGYVSEETDYSPKWRNSSVLAPVELTVIKKAQNLVNSNCE